MGRFVDLLLVRVTSANHGDDFTSARDLFAFSCSDRGRRFLRRLWAAMWARRGWAARDGATPPGMRTGKVFQCMMETFVLGAFFF